ncbi:GRAM domain-containing protein 4-like isoform X2 [Pomacea canaliculata]|uniref:GRAM domain-containing protein 4-like isoform X2 n=1 Tax=Pomacea canaliculata TaxID=400727 RepID=UPI000D73DABA|nr:GRAM domain-containing protein 4-like isoform X2 [Pomacea canaliculata]
MSLRSLRQRFKPDKPDERDDGRVLTPNEEFEVVPSLPEKDDCDRMSFHSAASHSPADAESVEAKFRDAQEKVIYEHQLNQLQEQLVAVMIDNQNLQQQLQEYQEKLDKDKTLALLEYERHRAQLLEERCAKLEKQKRPQRSKSDVVVRPLLQRRLSAGDMSDIEAASEAEEDSFSDTSVELPHPPPTQSRLDRMWEGLLQFVYGIMDDFTELPAEETEEDPEGDPLTVKKLKENIKRAGAAAKPYITTIQGIHNLLTWKSPPYTLIVFVVYMYSVWRGWFMPLLLLCLTFRLTINYLRYRGWNVNFHFFNCSEEDKKEVEDKDLGVSDKFNLVLQVARKVQNFLGLAADSLEKIKSLLTWRYPPATKQLFFLLLTSCIASCILPSSHIFFVAGLYLGFKMFILDYLFLRFPRFKLKYDSSYRIWKELPTDAEYEKKSMKSEIDRYILPKSKLEEADNLSEDTSVESLSVDDRQFCELFSLPLSESPLPGWHGGRRCTLINREKSLTAAFKNGRLYLTHSFLCFERTKAPSVKNIVIPLSDITRLEKAKPYAWIPGGGMAIEVTVTGSDKVLLFGALVSRDEIYNSIMEIGFVLDLPYATKNNKHSTKRTGKVSQARRSSNLHFQNFSLGVDCDSS